MTEQAQPSVAQFLEKLRAARAEWDALLNGISSTRMVEPGAYGDWSVKDVVAHVTWYEREMVDLLRERSLDGSDLWLLPHSERNEAIYRENRGRSLGEVLGEAKKVYEQLVAQVQKLSDEDLRDPTRFANMPEDWVPGDVFASNSYEHYPDHITELREWLEKQSV
jgi:hypothetical protein